MQLPIDWQTVLADEIKKPYFEALLGKVENEYQNTFAIRRKI
jgi:uracil DNA glycosylase